jgi:hypothetical protein
MGLGTADRESGREDGEKERERKRGVGLISSARNETKSSFLGSM